MKGNVHEKEKDVALDDLDYGFLRDYGDNKVKKNKRKLLSLVVPKTNSTLDNSSYARLHRDTLEKRESEGNSSVLKQSLAHNLQQNQTELQKEDPVQTSKQQGFVNGGSEFVLPNNTSFNSSKRDSSLPIVRSNQRDSNVTKSLRNKEIELNMPLQHHLKNSSTRAKIIAKGKLDKKWLDKGARKSKENYTEDESDYLWGGRGEANGATKKKITAAPVFDIQVKWNQTFQANHLDLQARRSDWIDLNCNISGNLLLRSSDALAIVNRFMSQLNAKHHG